MIVSLCQEKKSLLTLKATIRLAHQILQTRRTVFLIEGRSTSGELKP